MKSIFAVYITLFLIGCSNPGYSTRINLDKDSGAIVDDLKSITDFLLKTSHEIVMKKEKKEWKIESYKILLEGEKYQNIKHKYISFALEYSTKTGEYIGTSRLAKLEVRIGNSWEGRDPIIKEKIDAITDYVIDKLSSSINASKISIERRYTCPM